MRSRDTLSSFIRYCVRHPDERFWQALRNWSGYNFIYAAKYQLNCFVTDTFSFEGRRHDEKSKPSS